MGVGEPRERAAHAFGFGRIHAQAGAAGLGAEIQHIETAPGAGDNRGETPGKSAGLRSRSRDALARGAIEKLQIPFDGVGRILRFDRARVGGIDEGQPTGRVARPDRRRQLLDQGAQRSHLVEQFLVPAGESQKLALDAARILEAEHGAPRNGAALRLDRAAGERGEGHRESLAAGAQSFDRLLHRGGALRIEPTAEGQHAIRRGSADQRRIALDGRLVGCRRPVHHDLRLRQQQRIGAVEIAAQCGNLVVRGGFQPHQPTACAQQQDRRDHREQQKSGEQDDGRDLMTVYAARRALDELVQDKLRRLVGPGRRRRHPKSHQKSNGQRESVEPRTSVAPAAPDRVRHAPFASAGRHRHRQRVHRVQIANCWTLLSTGIAPKESRS